MSAQAAYPPDTTTVNQLLIPGGILYVISLVLVPSRIITRLRSAHTLFVDDYIILVAAVLAFVEFPLTAVAYYNGMGYWSYYASPARMTKALTYLYFAVFLLYPAVTLIRISVACSLLRLQRWSKTWTTILWVAVVLQMVVGTYGILLGFLHCLPLRALWEEVPGDRCWNNRSSLVAAYFFAAISIWNDTMFALMPISFIWKLNRPVAERILIGCLMALGLTAAFAAVMKVVKFSQSTNPDVDVMRNTFAISLWCKLEELLGLVAACAPTLKKPVENLLRRLGILGSHAMRSMDISFHTFSESLQIPVGRTNHFAEGNAEENVGGNEVALTEGGVSDKQSKGGGTTVSEMHDQVFGIDGDGATVYHGSHAV